MDKDWVWCRVASDSLVVFLSIYLYLSMSLCAIFVYMSDSLPFATTMCHTLRVLLSFQRMVFGNMNTRSGTGIAVAANALRGGDHHIQGK